MKKQFLALFAAFFFLIAPVSTFAIDCFDEDGDGYYADEISDPECLNRMGAKKEFEPLVCDCANIAEGETCHDGDTTIDIDLLSTVANPDMIPSAGLKGKNMHPGAVEKKDNGIDENCDGEDGQLVPPGEGLDIDNFKDTVLDLLIWGVMFVSVAVLIWGGIMYATAAGEEEKTRKARKAMIGAIVGLLIGISAYAIVNFVVERFV